jgi:hypothetical protein
MRLGVLIIAVMFVAGCGDSTQSATYYPSTSAAPSTSTPAQPQANTQPAPQQPATQSQMPSAYPLTQAQAYAYAGAGQSVAGQLPGGLEVLVMASTTTEYVEKPHDEQVCENQYGYNDDTAQYDYDYKCEYKTRYRQEPQERKVWIVAGSGAVRREYSSATSAMTQAISLGATAWRLA